jgi:hypothetical protein
MLHEALNQCASQGNPNNQRRSIYNANSPIMNVACEKELKKNGHMQGVQWPSDICHQEHKGLVPGTWRLPRVDSQKMDAKENILRIKKLRRGNARA